MTFLTAEYPPMPGGVGDYTRCLSQKLGAQGAQVSILTGSMPADMLPHPSHHHEQPVHVYRDITSWGWRCWKDTLTAIARIRPDVLHIQYQTGAYGMHPAINILPWRLRMCFKRPRLLVTFHDVLEPYLFPKAGLLRRWVNRWLAQGCDFVITTNDVDAQQLTRFCSPIVIPIGSNIDVSPPLDYERNRWRRHMGIAHDTFLIAYFGLITHSKGVDLLLDALMQLNQHQQMSYRLLLIGGKGHIPADQEYADNLIARITRTELREQVIWTGYVDTTDVSAHLLAADCVVLPFRQGASFRSGSLLAAMKHRVAVITTAPPPASPEQTMSGHALPPLEDGQQALLVPTGDSVALAKAIVRLAHDPPLRVRMSAAAQKIVDFFDWDTIAKGHMLLYQVS